MSAPPDATLREALHAAFATRAAWIHGAEFTVSLLAILVAHELGHYVAARIHKVDTSLPFFIPLPFLSPFGTMGAVIRMRGRIPTRRALLDIGASGPLAGLSLALPIYYYGAVHSRVIPIPDGAVELGDSLLIKLLDHLAVPNVPEGRTLLLSPFAFAAWAGMFVTMVNLLPIGQLDGGHVAYALFGKRQDVIARNIHRAVFLFFCGNVAVRSLLAWRDGVGLAGIGARLSPTLFWLTWFQMLAILGTVSRTDRKERVISPLARVMLTGACIMLSTYAKGEHPLAALALFVVVVLVMFGMERARGVFRMHRIFDHPETSDTALDPLRTGIAIATLAFFVLLFMPTPFSM